MFQTAATLKEGKYWTPNFLEHFVLNQELRNDMKFYIHIRLKRQRSANENARIYRSGVFYLKGPYNRSPSSPSTSICSIVLKVWWGYDFEMEAFQKFVALNFCFLLNTRPVVFRHRKHQAHLLAN